jgi:hypothetical protein
MSQRDPDPPESQVRILFGKNAGRCAYPECGKLLVMPSRRVRDQPKNVGKIAHITAASPSGPRYDASLTTEQRRSEPNLILLCGDHHDVVDAQLEFHTTEWLQKAKADNEERVSRGYEYLMGNIGFKHLEVVCGAISMAPSGSAMEIEEISIPIDTEEKIVINELGAESRRLIRIGLARQVDVRKFIDFMAQLTPNYEMDLVVWFKAVYYRGMTEGLRGDALFQSILGAAYENCGAKLTEEVSAAALAVVVDLFAICEIFEHERTPAR